MADSQKSSKKLTLKQTRFLAAYSRCGCISRAAVIVRGSRTTHYNALKISPTYATAFECAQEDFIDLLREAATHRAVKGVARKKFYQGLPCMVPVFDKTGKPVFDKEGEPKMEQYIEIEYSDQLLIQLLRAHCPEFAEKRRHEHTGPNGGPLVTENRQEAQFVETLAMLSAENLRHLDKAPKPPQRKKSRSKSKAKKSKASTTKEPHDATHRR